LGDKPRGRPQENVGRDHYKVSEAAEIIGVTDDTIRAWILSGRLIGDKSFTPKGEPRYRATKESVHTEAIRLGKMPTNAEMENAVEGIAARSVDEVLQAVQAMFAKTFAASDARIIESFAEQFRINREFNKQLVESLTQTIIEEHEKTRGTVGELTSVLREVRETEDKRREDGLSERRGFFRRIFSG
jgi:hypothetical protein